MILTSLSSRARPSMALGVMRIYWRDTERRAASTYTKATLVSANSHTCLTSDGVRTYQHVGADGSVDVVHEDVKLIETPDRRSNGLPHGE